MASGRYGGRATDNAGLRDFVKRVDPVSWTERVAEAKMEASLPAFFGPDGSCSSRNGAAIRARFALTRPAVDRGALRPISGA
jgi:hypothetical protein